MINALALAWLTLVRRPRRLALFVAGITVAAATALDMVMLSEGLQRSLAALLEGTGYQVRATPRGTLPFETQAAIPNSRALVDAFLLDPRVAEALPVWGRTLYVSTARAGAIENVPLFAMGAPAGSAPIVRVRVGAAPGTAEVVISPSLAEMLDVAVGDSLDVGIEPDPALGGLRRRRTMRISGTADFVFAPAGSYNIALPIDDLWSLAEETGEPAALLLVRTVRGADPYAVAEEFRRRAPNADVFAIPEIIEAAGDRLTYFQQLSLVLGTVSIGVAFLLVATLLTLSVNERSSEIAALRAIGVTRGRMLAQVAWSGFFLAGIGTAVGVAAGLAVARYLDSILLRFPGLPVEVSFFILEPRDAVVSAGILVLTGIAGGLYPAWRAASVEIAGALRESIE